MKPAPQCPAPAQDRTLAQQLGGGFALFYVLVAVAFFATAGVYGASVIWLAPKVDESRLAVMNESLNLTYVVGAVRESTATVGGYERVIVWLLDEERKRLVSSDHGAGSATDALE